MTDQSKGNQSRDELTRVIRQTLPEVTQTNATTLAGAITDCIHEEIQEGFMKQQGSQTRTQPQR